MLCMLEPYGMSYLFLSVHNDFTYDFGLCQKNPRGSLYEIFKFFSMELVEHLLNYHTIQVNNQIESLNIIGKDKIKKIAKQSHRIDL